MSRNPLGRETDYPQQYAPEVLHGIDRKTGRRELFGEDDPPFHGEDIWNAWELAWLDTSGRPRVATAEIRVPADSDRLVESKSLKLYLGSLAMSRYASAQDLAALITADLSDVTGATVHVSLGNEPDSERLQIRPLPGDCIDDANGEFEYEQVDASLLQIGADNAHDEELHSHLMRSNCPVTGQPDIGSILIRYRGPPIERSSLLQYLVSFRLHNDFHEACVERIFSDIRDRCLTERLTVYARYNRRGGLDINPFRSDFESRADNLRLWRQ